MALLFDLKALVDMMSIGTLFAYTLVAICILILRYRETESAENEINITSVSKFRFLNPPSYPTKETSNTVIICTVFNFFLVVVLTVLLSKAITSLLQLEVWSLVCVSVILFVMLLNTLVIWRQPQNPTKAAFMVPFLPLLPVVSTFINIYLMVQLGGATWIRYAVWMAVGLLIYFGYGVRNSVQKQRLLGNMSNLETTAETAEKDITKGQNL
ncbi:cationic amino acid transporter 2-like isoform X1 [Tachysurus ichikawai]